MDDEHDVIRRKRRNSEMDNLYKIFNDFIYTDDEFRLNKYTDIQFFFTFFDEKGKTLFDTKEENMDIPLYIDFNNGFPEKYRNNLSNFTITKQIPKFLRLKEAFVSNEKKYICDMQENLNQETIKKTNYIKLETFFKGRSADFKITIFGQIDNNFNFEKAYLMITPEKDQNLDETRLNVDNIKEFFNIKQCNLVKTSEIINFLKKFNDEPNVFIHEDLMEGDIDSKQNPTKKALKLSFDKKIQINKKLNISNFQMLDYDEPEQIFLEEINDKKTIKILSDFGNNVNEIRMFMNVNRDDPITYFNLNMISFNFLKAFTNFIKRNKMYFSHKKNEYGLTKHDLIREQKEHIKNFEKIAKQAYTILLQNNKNINVAEVFVQGIFFNIHNDGISFKIGSSVPPNALQNDGIPSMFRSFKKSEVRIFDIPKNGRRLKDGDVSLQLDTHAKLVIGLLSKERKLQKIQNHLEEVIVENS